MRILLVTFLICFGASHTFAQPIPEAVQKNKKQVSLPSKPSTRKKIIANKKTDKDNDKYDFVITEDLSRFNERDWSVSYRKEFYLKEGIIDTGGNNFFKKFEIDINKDFEIELKAEYIKAANDFSEKLGILFSSKMDIKKTLSFYASEGEIEIYGHHYENDKVGGPYVSQHYKTVEAPETEQGKVFTLKMKRSGNLNQFYVNGILKHTAECPLYGEDIGFFSFVNGGHDMTVAFYKFSVKGIKKS